MSHLSVIIPTFNRCSHLRELLLNFKAQQNCTTQYTIVVVVDGSTDGTIEMLRDEFPMVKVVMGDGNWWWTRSINEGLKYAISIGSDLFLLMNDDTIIKPTFLAEYLSQYRAAGGGVLGAISVTNSNPEKIYYSGVQSVSWTTAKQVRYHKFYETYNSHVKGMHSTVFIPGRGMLFGDDVVNRIGLFRDKLFPQYYADYDYSYLALKAGFGVNVTWDTLIYSHIELTAKGNKTNSNFSQFLASFLKPNTSNSAKRTWLFYAQHGGLLFPLGFTLHILRNVVAFLISKIRKEI